MPWDIIDLLPDLPELPVESLLDGIGIPDSLHPTPFPFPPLPKGLLFRFEGLKGYRAYALRNSTLEYLGMVYGEDESEAIEAAENKAEMDGGGFTAVKVAR